METTIEIITSTATMAATRRIVFLVIRAYGNNLSSPRHSALGMTVAKICKYAYSNLSQSWGEEDTMGNDPTTFDAYTTLMEFKHETLGTFMVVIEGVHDLDRIQALDHTMYVGTLKKGVFALLCKEDGDIDGDELIAAVRTYHYMVESDIISSDHQPYLVNVEGMDTDELVIETAEHGIIGITYVGGVEYEDDYYEIFTANPATGVYLVIILELIDDDPVEYLMVNVEVDPLRDGIIQAFLVEENLIDDEEDDDDDEEDSSISDC